MCRVGKGEGQVKKAGTQVLTLREQSTAANPQVPRGRRWWEDQSNADKRNILFYIPQEDTTPT